MTYGVPSDSTSVAQSGDIVDHITGKWHAPYGSLGSAAYSELINKTDTFAAQSHVFPGNTTWLATATLSLSQMAGKMFA